MQVSFVDLSKKFAEIIKALSQKECVTVLNRGKSANFMEPIGDRITREPQPASQHKAFGIWADKAETYSGPST